MAALTPVRMKALLEPYFADPSEDLLRQLSTYLDLLLKWNAKTNLTAIRDPETIVRRHFGESLFTAGHLPPGRTLLDFGSGAGFPGIPIQLVHPHLQVTLGESQHKKAAFLREAVRVLGTKTEVWAERVEGMRPDRRFDLVTLRAVDNMQEALGQAQLRLSPGGYMVHLGILEGSRWPLPNSTVRGLHLIQTGCA